jgi:hypothetical protein
LGETYKPPAALRGALAGDVDGGGADCDRAGADAASVRQSHTARNKQPALPLMSVFMAYLDTEIVEMRRITRWRNLTEPQSGHTQHHIYRYPLWFFNAKPERHSVMGTWQKYNSSADADGGDGYSGRR